MKRILLPFTVPYWVCRTGSYLLSVLTLTGVASLFVVCVILVASGFRYMLSDHSFALLFGLPWPLWSLVGPVFAVFSFFLFFITKETADGYYKKCINYWHSN